MASMSGDDRQSRKGNAVQDEEGPHDGLERHGPDEEAESFFEGTKKLNLIA